MCKSSIRNSTISGVLGACALVAGVVLFVPGASAQQQPALPADSSPPPEAQAAPPPAIPAVPAGKPGVFESIGRFFDKGAENFRQSMQGAKQKFDEMGSNAAQTGKVIGDRASDVGKGAADFGKGAADFGKGAADATKGAAEAIVKLPTARVVNGRETCGVAANGAPDCQSAAQALCKKQGYATGKSMDFTSAEQCPARVWISGRQGNAECTTVTFISRAMCQ